MSDAAAQILANGFVEGMGVLGVTMVAITWLWVFFK